MVQSSDCKYIKVSLVSQRAGQSSGTNSCGLMFLNPLLSFDKDIFIRLDYVGVGKRARGIGKLENNFLIDGTGLLIQTNCMRLSSKTRTF